MQVNENGIVEWLLAVIPSALVALFWYIWRGDRSRIKTLEEKMSNAVTMPQVEHIVEQVEKHFKDDHKDIIHEVRGIQEELRIELRELRREIISVIRQPWGGQDRRDE